MLIPRYWAEATRQASHKGRTLRVRRFGWSEESLDAAQKHADERAEEALSRILSGERLPKKERASSYNGSDGIPIREEILETLEGCTLTRNGYGAKCLNTPNVLIGDIDFEIEPIKTTFLKLVGVALVFSFALGVISVPFGIAAFILSLFLSIKLHQKQVCAHKKHALENLEIDTLHRIRHFTKSRPEWHLRVYRSPNGFRVMAMQDLFDPSSETVQTFFEDLQVDPLYMRMCQKQQCFRARLTPKPWRMNLEQWSDLKPRPWDAVGPWPASEAGLNARDSWLQRYDELSQPFSACRFVEACGSSTVHPLAQKICDIHDHMSQCNQSLTLG